MNRFQNTRLC